MKPARLLLALATGAMIGAAAGCRRSPATRLQETRAFANAPPALKESWQHAAACLQTNNYLVAAPLLFELRRQPLSPEQAAVVDDVLKPILEQLYAAADRGDTAAIRVVTALQRRPRR